MKKSIFTGFPGTLSVLSFCRVAGMKIVGTSEQILSSCPALSWNNRRAMEDHPKKVLVFDSDFPFPNLQYRSSPS